MTNISSGVFLFLLIWKEFHDHGDVTVCQGVCKTWNAVGAEPFQTTDSSVGWYHNLTHCKHPSIGVFGVSGPVSLMGSVTMTEDLLLWWEILATPRSIFRNSASSCSIVNFCIAYTSHHIPGWQQRQEKLQGIMNENLEYSFPIFQSFAFQTCQSLPSGPMNR